MRRLVIASIVFVSAAFFTMPFASAAVHPTVRIKELAHVEGVRSNQLTGLGLVVGLQGTGDRSQLALRMMRNMVTSFGISTDEKMIRSRNAAVVTVTAQLSPFVRQGQTVDVVVSAMGDAKSLEGGVLLQTPLQAADGKVYAVAQGPVTVGGFVAGGAAARVTKNVTTTGRIPGGAIVERDVSMDFVQSNWISLLLEEPDFTTAQRIANAINERYGGVARPADAGRVEVAVPPRYTANPTTFIAQVEQLEVTPDALGRVVVNERTGTVVMGGQVGISAVTVAHGNLTVRVVEAPEVVQPEPFGAGVTAVVPRTGVAVTEGAEQLVSLPASSTVDELVKAMNAIGATPRDIITILQAIDQAGALHGELVVM